MDAITGLNPQLIIPGHEDNVAEQKSSKVISK